MSGSSYRNDLWRRFFCGEHDVLDDIARQCHDDLLRRVQQRLRRDGLASRLGGELDAVDICQNIYLTLWRQRIRDRPHIVANIEAYLQRLVRNRVRHEWRRATARRRDLRRLAPVPDDASLAAVPESVESTESVWALERAEFLRESVRGESPVNQQIVELAAQGSCWREIGSRLNLSANTVRMRFFRIARRLSCRWRDDKA